MSIKERITIGFGLLVAALLVLFSFFIYQTFESYRRDLMRTRLQRRALAAQTYFLNRKEFLRSSYFALPEQHEILLDERNQRIYASIQDTDYSPTPQLITEARSRQVVFDYDSPRWPYAKEGIALSFVHQNRQYVAVVTAYDLDGRQTSRNLLFILFIGNVASMLVIALVGLVFARRAMRPFDHLIREINATTVDDFSFRLTRPSRNDEATYLSDSFNDLLDRLHKLALSQKHFVSYASHEIRTPLTVVKGILETSLAYDGGLGEMRQSMEKALRRLDGAIDLANNLLRLAEIENLAPSQLSGEINVVDVVFDTINYFQEKYPHQEIEVQLTDSFTEHSTGFRIVGSASLLRVVLINVIDNACKYSDFKLVGLRVDYIPREVIIVVEDQGIGIPESEVNEVFLPLMRATNTGAVRGHGLGLTLSKKIIDMHQGKLDIKSIAGVGTTVSIHISTRPL